MTGIDVAGSLAPSAPRRALRVAGAAVGLIRPFDSTSVAIGTIVGARIAGATGLPPLLVGSVALSTGLLCAGSMAFNDLCDVEADIINRPASPLVAGHLGTASVRKIAVALFASGVLVALGAGPGFAAASVGLIAASVAYSRWLKAVPLLGNTIVAAVISFPLWCWLLAGAAPTPRFLTLCAALFLARLAAEVIKTGEDTWGDHAAGLATVATLLGAPTALRLGSAGLLAASTLTWLAPSHHHQGAVTNLALTVATGLAVTAWVVAARPTQAPTAAARRLVHLGRAWTFVVAVGLVFTAA